MSSFGEIWFQIIGSYYSYSFSWLCSKFKFVNPFFMGVNWWMRYGHFPWLCQDSLFPSSWIFFPCFAHVFEYVILLEIPLCNMMVGCDWNFMYSGHLNLICNFVLMVKNSLFIFLFHYMYQFYGCWLVKLFQQNCVSLYPVNKSIETPLSSIFWNLGISCDLKNFHKVSLRSNKL